MTRSTSLVRSLKHGAGLLALLALAACGGDEGESDPSNTCSVTSPLDCPPPTICITDGLSFEGVCGLPPSDAGVDADAGTDVVQEVVDDVGDTNTTDVTDTTPDTAVDTVEEVSTESICNDGVDNDGDGATDCADVDCATNIACTSEAGACNDGVDNDNDGRTDCFDTDCRGDVNCPSTESNCGDGIDNDFDNAIDCADPDCGATPACPETNCGDRIDNNNNGSIDCADPGCNGIGFCAPETGLACNDSRDNDGDGAIDCNDLDCADAQACETEFVPWLVYQAGVSALPTLYAISADGSEGPFAIEDDSVVHVARLPAFSDDGSLLAYDYASAGIESIRLLALETGDLTDLGNGFFTTVSQPSFSADGSTIAVIGTTTDFPRGNVYTIAISTGAVTGPLTNQLDAAQSIQSPVFNADASQIYFVRGVPGQEGTGDVFRIDIDGSNETQITTDLVIGGGLKMNLDRTEFVFKPNAGVPRVYTIATDSLRTLSSGSLLDSSPSYFGTTGNFLVSRAVRVGGTDADPVLISDLFVLTPNGAEAARITNTPGLSEGAPVASPLPFDSIAFILPE